MCGRLSSFVDELRSEVHFPCYLQAETGPDVQDEKGRSCVLQNQRVTDFDLASRCFVKSYINGSNYYHILDSISKKTC